MFPTKPKEKSETGADVEIENLVEEIAGIIEWENAGIKTDWNYYPFEFQSLAVVWRETQMQLKSFKEERMFAAIERQSEILIAAHKITFK